MNAQLGTYALDSMSSPEQEMVRLKKQAELLPKIELRALVEHGLKKNMQVLDAACGPGLTACMIDDYLDTGSVTGIDLNPTLLKEAEKLAWKKRKRIRFESANVYFLPYKNQFDYIYCRFLFQHLESPEKALQSLWKALKPGGILHILDVNDDWLFLEPEVPAFTRLSNLAAQHQARKGGNRFIGKELRNIMVKEGFGDLFTSVISVSSDMVGMDTFLNITTSFKAEIIDPEPNQPHPQELLKEIKKEVANRDTYGMVGVFNVSARKSLTSK